MDSQSYGSFDLWFRFPTIASALGLKNIVSVYPTTTTDEVFIISARYLGTTSSNRIDLTVRGTSGGSLVGNHGNTVILPNVTYHVVVSKNSGTGLNIYLNGSAETLTNWVGTGAEEWIDSSNPRKVINAARYVLSSGGTLQGWQNLRLGAVRYWPNYTLSAGEALDLYNRGKGNPWSDVNWPNASYATWPIGDSIRDYRGDGNHTLANLTSSDFGASLP